MVKFVPFFLIQSLLETKVRFGKLYKYPESDLNWCRIVELVLSHLHLKKNMITSLYRRDSNIVVFKKHCWRETFFLATRSLNDCVKDENLHEHEPTELSPRLRKKI